MHSETILKLADRTPVSSGTESLVFEHPDNPDRLIKVLTPHRRNTTSHKKQPWYKRLRRDRPYLFAIRQVREYMSYQYRGKGHLDILAEVHGFIRSDLGFGFVVERVRDYNDRTSETLEMVVRREGITEDIQKIVDAYCTALYEHRIVMIDIKSRNLMVVVHEGGDRHLVAIDSFGERNLLPMSTALKWWNGRHIRRHKEKLLSELKRLETEGLNK